MKKTIALLLSALLLISALAGCGAKKEEPVQETPAPTEAPAATPAPTPTPTPEPTEAPTVGDEPVTGTPEGSVIFAKDGVTVTTAGLGDDDGLPIIWVDVENSGDKALYLGVTDGSVNGFMTSTYLINYYEDEYGSPSVDYSYDQNAPAGETVRYALGYSRGDVNGVDLSTLSELTLYFTLTEDEDGWPYYTSAPITLETGETVPDVDITALGTTVIDDDRLLLVIGEQDYDDFFGPEVAVYMENRTDGFLGLMADTAEADEAFCDYIYGAVYAAPHKRTGGFMCFEEDIKSLPGFEALSVDFSLYAAEDHDGLNTAAGEALETVSVTYPPQVWGEYANGNYTMTVTPKYNDLITVETPENDPDGILFTVSETASLEAGDHEGAGWLFSIAKISADKLHQLLCWDMSGVEVFAKDYEGNYFVYCHPTDVRFERATVEEMQRDSAQWSMLNEWADGMKDRIREENYLISESYGNSELDMYVARAAWDKDTKATIAFLEPYGEVALDGVDGTAYADFLLHGWFCEDTEGTLEAPDGEYMVLNVPEEDVRIDFFWGDPTIARVTRDGEERLYEAFWSDDSISYAEAVHGWYYAAAEKAGLKEADTAFDAYLGGWHEPIAGRCAAAVTPSVAPGKVNVYIRWPGSVASAAEWELVASLDEEGKLVYENGHYEVNEYDENGESWNTDWSDEASGWFSVENGTLLWHDDTGAGGETELVRD